MKSIASYSLICLHLGSRFTVHGWAPAPIPDQTQAWRFTQESTKTIDEHEHHYFDGHGSSSMHWNDAPAFVQKKAAPALEERSLEPRGCDHVFFDGTGDALCWPAVSSKAKSEQHHYFDGHAGASIQWNDPLHAAAAAIAPISSSVDEISEEQHDCDHFYYGEAGDAHCWLTPSKTAGMLLAQTVEQPENEHHYFDGHGAATIRWNDAVPTSAFALRSLQVLPPINANELSDHFFYDAMGAAVYWPSSPTTTLAVQEDLHFFDHAGAPRVWNAISAPTKPATTSTNSIGKQKSEECNHDYYDKMGYHLCW